MTERREQPTRVQAEPRRKERGPLTVLWSAVALFLAVLAVLAVRLRAGEDPALRAARQHASLPARHVLVRRVLERRVVVHVPPTEPAPAASASQQVGAAGAFGATLPTTRTS
jgi:hypothetical protein